MSKGAKNLAKNLADLFTKMWIGCISQMFDNEVHYQTFGILENYLDYKSLKQGIYRI